MRALLGLCLILTLAAAARPVQADPSVRLSWGTCDPIVANQNFIGPDTYRLVISGTGIAGTYMGCEITLIVLPSDGRALPDAWRFDEAGCHSPTELDVSPYGVSKACPAFPAINPLWGVFVDFGAPAYPPNSLRLRLIKVGDEEVADPATRYTLFVLAFDQARAVAGPGTPGESCGDADVPVCFYVADAGVAPPEPPMVGMTTENPGVTWQGAHYGGGSCSAFIPGKPDTWGRLKALYR